MSDLVTIKVSKDSLKDAFAERLWYWEGEFCDRFLTALCAMYSDAIDEGAFDNAEVDIQKIVDNAVINDFDFAEFDGVIQIIDARSNNVVYEVNSEEV